MVVQPLERTTGFIVFDLDGAPTSVGVVRLAPKVLQDGAALLARSTTYACATFGLQIGGGSGAINSTPDERTTALEAFVEEVAPLVSDGRWLVDPGDGVTEQELGPLRAGDPRPAALWENDLRAELVGRGAAAAAEAAVGEGGLKGRRAIVVGSGPAAVAAADAARIRGAAVVDGRLTDDAAVVFVGGKAGNVTHELAAEVKAGVVVPISPVPVTARAMAWLGQAGRVVVPDFVSTAAPLLAAFDPDGDPVERVGASMAEIAGAGIGAWLAAAERAETFLRTWRDELPFGRPLA
jgi:glutamate dehydrogenase/leucine dehydrogenase